MNLRRRRGESALCVILTPTYSCLLCSNGPYTYERVATEIESLEVYPDLSHANHMTRLYNQPELLGIMSGDIYSHHHNVFLSGSMRDKGQLKMAEQRGPIKNWPAERVSINNSVVVV